MKTDHSVVGEGAEGPSDPEDLLDLRVLVRDVQTLQDRENEGLVALQVFRLALQLLVTRERPLWLDAVQLELEAVRMEHRSNIVESEPGAEPGGERAAQILFRVFSELRSALQLIILLLGLEVAVLARLFDLGGQNRLAILRSDAD